MKTGCFFSSRAPLVVGAEVPAQHSNLDIRRDEHNIDCRCGSAFPLAFQSDHHLVAYVSCISDWCGFAVGLCNFSIVLFPPLLLRRTFRESGINFQRLLRHAVHLLNRTFLVICIDGLGAVEAAHCRYDSASADIVFRRCVTAKYRADIVVSCGGRFVERIARKAQSTSEFFFLLFRFYLLRGLTSEVVDHLHVHEIV